VIEGDSGDNDEGRYDE